MLWTSSSSFFLVQQFSSENTDHPLASVRYCLVYLSKTNKASYVKVACLKNFQIFLGSFWRKELCSSLVVVLADAHTRSSCYFTGFCWLFPIRSQLAKFPRFWSKKAASEARIYYYFSRHCRMLHGLCHCRSSISIFKISSDRNVIAIVTSFRLPKCCETKLRFVSIFKRPSFIFFTDSKFCIFFFCCDLKSYSVDLFLVGDFGCCYSDLSCLTAWTLKKGSKASKYNFHCWKLNNEA